MVSQTRSDLDRRRYNPPNTSKIAELNVLQRGDDLEKRHAIQSRSGILSTSTTSTQNATPFAAARFFTLGVWMASNSSKNRSERNEKKRTSDRNGYRYHMAVHDKLNILLKLGSYSSNTGCGIINVATFTSSFSFQLVGS